MEAHLSIYVWEEFVNLGRFRVSNPKIALETPTETFLLWLGKGRVGEYLCCSQAIWCNAVTHSLRVIVQVHFPSSQGILELHKERVCICV